MYKRIEMNWARNTRHRFCLALVVSMLFCGLSSIEIPELTRLTDDTSNDFTLVEVASTPSCTASESSSTGTIQAVRVSDSHPEYRLQPFVSLASGHSPSGYLHLLCVHRT